MKILVVCQYYYPEQFRINDICESLVKRGNEVTVLTGLPNYPEGIVKKEYKFFKKRKENINGVNVIRCFEIGRRKGFVYRILNYISYMVSASVKSIFLKGDFDLVYVYQLSPITMAVPAIVYKKTHKNKKIHLYCLDLWPESLLVENFSKDGKVYKILKKISKKIYKNCDYISVTSRSFIDYFKDKLEINKDITYIPQYAEDIYTHRDNIVEKGKVTNFVFAGNIGRAQSVETIIKAANELKNEKIIIHIVGDGSSLEDCKKMKDSMKLENVIFYGRKSIDEIEEYYNLADAMIITLSNNDIISKTIPGKLQSYMSAGKPIIAAIGGETYKIINDAKCGYCVEAEEYNKLAIIMRKFANDTLEKRKEMSENSYSYYQNNFNKENVINKIEKELKEEI